VIKPERATIDYGQQIQNLPYVFHDPVRFDKKIDPRKMTFGSKIDVNGNGNGENHFLRLKHVISPNIIELDNDLIVRLIGIRPKAAQERAATKWLQDKLKGQSIYLKFDQTKYDEHDRLLSYLYLKNKTFVNLHFLRSNLVQLDQAFPFRYFNKFKAIIEEGSPS